MKYQRNKASHSCTSSPFPSLTFTPCFPNSLLTNIFLVSPCVFTKKIFTPVWCFLHTVFCFSVIPKFLNQIFPLPLWFNSHFALPEMIFWGWKAILSSKTQQLQAKLCFFLTPTPSSTLGCVHGQSVYFQSLKAGILK